MKSKFLLVLLAGAFVCSFTACGASNTATTEVKETVQEETVEKDAATDDLPLLEDGYAISDCVELGNYQGLEVHRTVGEISDQDIIEKAHTYMSPRTLTDKNAAVQEGDTVEISYQCTIDGELDEDRCSDSYSLTIGANAVIEGFDQALIGLKTGEETTFELTFPEDYWDESVAGKPVQFDVRIKGISRYPDITDEYVKKFTEGEFETAEAFKEEIKSQVLEDKEKEADSAMEDEIWGKAMDNATFKALPKSYYDKASEAADTSMKLYATMYGMELEDFLQNVYGYDEEGYAAYRDQYARTVARSMVFLDALAEKEGITQDDEFTKLLKAYAEEMNKDPEEMLADETKDETIRYIYMEMLLNRMKESAKIIEG